MKHYFLIIACALLPPACGYDYVTKTNSFKAPLVYRIDIQQGNVIEQFALNKLAPGMDKNKVRFVLGTPLLVDPFHTDRWDYIYSLEPGSGERVHRRITVFFKDDKLTHIKGNITPGRQRSELDDEREEVSNILVQGEGRKKGFFERLFGADQRDVGDLEPDQNTNTRTNEDIDPNFPP